MALSRLTRTVVPFYWAPLTLTFTQGTAASYDLEGFLANPRGYDVAYGHDGALPAGVLHVGSVVSYNGTAPVAATSVNFVAIFDAFRADSGPTAVTIGTVPVNAPPVWLTAANLTALEPGVAFQSMLRAQDPEGDPIEFVYGPPPFGQVTEQAQVGSIRALIWNGTTPRPSAYTTYPWSIDARSAATLGQVKGLTATANSPSTVALAWSGVTGATGYIPERSLTGSGSWTVLPEVAVTVATASGLTPATTYYFRVRAHDATRQGEYSATVSATTP